MNSNWVKVKLQDLGVVKRGKSKHRPRNAPFLYGGKYPFVQTSDIKNANLYITEYTQTYSEEGLKQSKLWDEGTLCITIAANIAESAILKFKSCFPDSIVAFTPYKESSDVRFVKYLLDYYKKNFQNISKGTTQDNLSVEKINSLELLVPDLPTQLKIASILSAYDDLIENNTRRIKILEEIAQTIYKEWFVNFRFPGHEKVKFVDSPLGNLPAGKAGIPEGGEPRKLGELISFVKGKKPKKVHDEQFNGAVNLLLLDNIASGNYQYTDYEERICITENDIVMVMDGASSGKVIIGLNGFLGSTLATLKINDDTKSVYQIYYFLQENFKNISDNNTGAAIPHASKEYIAQLDFVKATQSITVRFNEIAASFHNEIRLLKIKNKNLRKTRDLLLPKLM